MIFLREMKFVLALLLLIPILGIGVSDGHGTNEGMSYIIPTLELEKRNLTTGSCFNVFQYLHANKFPSKIEMFLSEKRWLCFGSGISRCFPGLNKVFLKIILLERVYEIAMGYQFWLNEVTHIITCSMEQCPMRHQLNPFNGEKFMELFQRAFIFALDYEMQLESFGHNLTLVLYESYTSQDHILDLQTEQNVTIENITKLITRHLGLVDVTIDEIFFNINQTAQQLLDTVPGDCCSDNQLYTIQYIPSYHIPITINFYWRICENITANNNSIFLERILDNTVTDVNQKAKLLQDTLQELLISQTSTGTDDTRDAKETQTSSTVNERDDSTKVTQSSTSFASTTVVRTTTTTAAVTSPPDTSEVQFRISGPRTINSCGSYQLKAEQISGHQGMALTYNWQLITPAEKLENSSFSSKALQNATGILPIDATTLTLGIEYNLTLTVTNYMDTSKTHYHTITVVDGLTPVLQIKPINVIPNKVRSLTRIRLEAYVTYSFGDNCKVEVTRTAYQWTSNMSNLLPNVTNKRELVIPPHTLPVGASVMFSATVTSTIAETDVTVGDNIIITIIASPLVAHIRGASQRKVGPDDMIELDGSLSSDPDEPEGKNISTLQFEWTCLKVPTKPSCDIGQDRTLEKLRFSSSMLGLGEFEINLKVTKDNREMTSSIILEVQKNPVHLIKMTTRGDRNQFRDDEDVYIQANIRIMELLAIGDLHVTWQEKNNMLDNTTWRFGLTEYTVVARDDQFTTHIVIPASETEPGISYSIFIITTLTHTEATYAMFNFSIYSSIHQCQVETTQYEEMEPLTIRATGCFSDSDTQPLTYQPFLRFELDGGDDVTIVLGGSRGDVEQIVIATPIVYDRESVTVGLKVCDTRMTCIDVSSNTGYISRNTTLTEAEIETFITERITNELMKGNIGTAFINTVSLSSLDRKLMHEQQRRRRDVNVEVHVNTADINTVLIVVNNVDLDESKDNVLTRVGNYQIQILDMIASSGPPDTSDGDVILIFFPQMVQQSFTEANIDTQLEALRKIMEKAKDEGHQLSYETVDRTLTALSTTGEKVKSKGWSQTKRESQLHEIRELRIMALQQLGKALNIESNLVFNIRGNRMGIFSFLPQEDTWLQHDNLHVFLRPGDSIQNMFGYNWCSDDVVCDGLNAILIELDDLDKNVTKCSNFTDVQLLNPITGNPEAITSLEDRMELNFTLVSGDLSDCVCKFWNETTGKLEETGVITSTHDGHVICKTDHLTSFVVVRATHVPGSGTNHLGTIVIILALVTFVVLLVVISGILIKFMHKKKIYPARE
ncbi:uncharacterized protein [Apostichopus japonicus]|uniref:uncharacterized protein isoform X3 n=1 Tax=Stichopus japonicus TaxID=307972 RepID=UPI003AB4707F